MTAEPVGEVPCRSRQYSTWTSRCKCPECKPKIHRIDKLRKTNRTPSRETSRKIREAARRVISEHIQDGWSQKAIADAYNIPVWTVERFAGRRDASLPGPAVARLVLAGPVRRPRVGWLPAWPIARRLQALGWLGWSSEAIAARLGVSDTSVSRLQSGGRSSVSPRVDEAVRALYRELEGTPGPSDAASRHAVTRGWAQPAAWDNIDDRDERPKGVSRVIRERPRP